MAPERPLGMRRPTDHRHRALYPLTAGTMPDKPTPVVIGINWWTQFDAPVAGDGAHWIGRSGDWGVLRGGHAICIRPPALKDEAGWWTFYEQHRGDCVGYSIARMMSLLNRRRYAAWLLYDEAQQIDEFSDTPPAEGTTVRAGADVARTLGLHPVRGKTIGAISPRDGIATNRWANSVEEIAACLSPADTGALVLNRGYVELLQSWGRSYPHMVRLPLEALSRLVFSENGEATVVVDR
jgi:hypothetical protein